MGGAGALVGQGEGAAGEHTNQMAAIVGRGVEVGVGVGRRLGERGGLGEGRRLGRGVPPTPVKASRAAATWCPSAASASRQATPTSAKSPWRRLTSRKAQPPPGGGAGRRTSTSSSVGSTAVVR